MCDLQVATVSSQRFSTNPSTNPARAASSVGFPPKSA